MAETSAIATVGAVCLLLAVGLIQQFVVAGPWGAKLDRLAIVPHWKFFAHQKVDSNAATFDDPHIVARIGKADGSSSEWQEIWSPPERSWLSTMWNPHLRSDAIITDLALLLGGQEKGAQPVIVPTGLAYLTILRLCIDRLPLQSGEPLQFAIAMTRGTENRTVELRLLSSWHSQ